MKMKCIVIDDESRSREMLRHLLQNCIPDVEFVGEAANVPEGVKCILKTNPDIVFLDIEMPMYSGLELLDFFDKGNITFKIIFVTAYAEHALKAFRLSAVDYLLKPIQIEHLREAIQKVTSYQIKAEQISALQNNYLQPPAQNQIALSLAEGLTVIHLDDILFLAADGSYTQLILAGGNKITASKVLGEFSFLTENHSFFRTNRSHIINISKIKRISRHKNQVVLCNEQEVSITPEKKSELIQLFQHIKI